MAVLKGQPESQGDTKGRLFFFYGERTDRLFVSSNKAGLLVLQKIEEKGEN